MVSKREKFLFSSGVDRSICSDRKEIRVKRQDGLLINFFRLDGEKDRKEAEKMKMEILRWWGRTSFFFFFFSQ